MVPEEQIGEIVRSAPDLRSAGARAGRRRQRGGGRDNITVVLFRVEEVGADAARAGDASTEHAGGAARRRRRATEPRPRRAEVQPRASRARPRRAAATARRRGSPLAPAP